MSCETWLHGRVELGELPEGVEQRLERLPGEWLEFEQGTSTIVVRLCQPSAGPCLPTISGELVRMMAEVPESLQPQIPGGDLYLHTEQTGQLVRLRVEPGGEVRISWAHPHFTHAERRLYGEERGPLVDPCMQCLVGCVNFVTSSPAQAGRELEALADTYEGLYPEGEFLVATDEARRLVNLTMSQVNLDVHLLIERLLQLAAPGSLSGRIDLMSFCAASAEQHARFLFEKGVVWVQRPVLWEEPEAVVS